MLQVKRIGIDTYGENVAFLSAHCKDYKSENFSSLNKIEVVSKNSNGMERRIMATLNIVENGDILSPNALGLSVSAFADLDMPEGTPVLINVATPPKSLDAVRRKISGEILSAQDLDEIVRDMSSHRYSKMEIAAFLVSSAAFMTTEEVLSLTKSMANVGARLSWDFPQVLDKHCIGGIPGNRTSMIVVPIVAAHGLPIPKTSSRAITSPAGTADTMEVLANVDLGIPDMQRIVHSHHGCLAWGGQVNLSPADDIMISVERPLGIDTPEQMVASILSKKVAAGSTHLVIDMPVGPTAKVRSQSQAARLRKLFEYIGKSMGLEIDVLVTNGNQPIGRGIGPVLEARDVMDVLKRERPGPQDLRDHSLLLAGRLLEFDPKLKGGTGIDVARKILESGAALQAMENIIAAQGAPPKESHLGRLTKEITSNRNGTVTAIDCFRIARIARLAGAPASKGAGVDLLKKIGDVVKSGEPLYRIYAAVETDFEFSTEMAEHDSGYIVS